MLAFLTAVCVFLTVSCLAVALYRRSVDGRPAERRLHQLGDEQRADAATRQGLLLRRGPSSIPGLRDRLVDSAWAERAALDLSRAGMNLRVGEYLLLRVLLGFAGFLVPVIASGMAIAGFIAGAVLGLVGLIAPALYVNFRKQRRRRAIEGQLAEALTHIANAMRAGFALLQAIDSAARRLQPPLAEEFGRLVADVNLGSNLEDALVDLSERVGSYDLDLVITAILIQRTSGGNLSEVLENVAETMRERDRVRGEIRVLTASQRFAGWVLSLWPVALAFIFVLLNPDIMSNLWTTTAGLVLLGAAGVLQLLGFFTIRRIIAIDI